MKNLSANVLSYAATQLHHENQSRRGGADSTRIQLKGGLASAKFPCSHVSARKLKGFLMTVSLAGALLSNQALAQNPQVVEALTGGGQGEVIERGQDFAVHRFVSPLTNETGRITYRTNQFKLLENNLSYFDAGVWKISEDLIESFPGGAVAERGPNKAIFSPDAGDVAVFDILTADQKRLRGGVRAIQLTDVATGNSVVLATVKRNGAAPGQLLPPNQLVYLDCFDGLRADLLLIWKHNVFCHEVVLRQRPELPEGMAAASTRLEIITEFVESPDPVLNEQVFRKDGNPDLVDHAVISFGQLALVHGKAFSVGEEKAVDADAWSWSDAGSPVLKQWQELPDGRKFLVESISWTAMAPLINDLPLAGVKNTLRPAQGITNGRVWPDPVIAVAKREPVQIASIPYRPKGFVVDFVTLPNNPLTTTFLSGETYYIPSSYYTGSAVTFQPGCTVKYANNAYMLLYGSVTFPPAGQLMPVFTSKDDDTVGKVITGPNGSDGNPADQRAAKAIWIYYVTFDTTIRNARIRWAQTGIRYDANPGVYANHYVNDALFQDCTTGIYSDIQGGTLYLSNVKNNCNVTTPVSVISGYISGSMAEDCGPAYIAASYAGLQMSSPEIVAGDKNEVPDTMGAVGPDHFVEVVNFQIKIFNKYTGQGIASVSAREFFRPQNPPNPISPFFDPRVVYDHYHNRWIMIMADRSTQDVILAFSTGSDPVGNGESGWLTSRWTRYTLGMAKPCCKVDYPTVAYDANGIYVAASFVNDIGCSTCDFNTRVAAIWTQDIISNPSAMPVGAITILQTPTQHVIQPVTNFDTDTDIVWLVGRSTTGLPNRGTDTLCGRLYWDANHVAHFVGNDLNTWATITLTALPTHFNLVPSGPDTMAPTPGFSIDLSRQGDRWMNAVKRNGNVYICRHVGVDSAGSYAGTVDRTACEWVKLQRVSDGLGSYTLSYSDYRRVYDQTSPFLFYYMPSLAGNSRGDVVMGFSGSKSTTYISAYFATLLNSAAPGTAPTVKLLASGANALGNTKWGDYSFTSVDPKDGVTIWTIQEYAPAPNGYSTDWATSIGAVCF